MTLQRNGDFKLCLQLIGLKRKKIHSRDTNASDNIGNTTAIILKIRPRFDKL
jgi:hypothetical protein